MRVFDGVFARLENDQPKECGQQPVSGSLDAVGNGEETSEDSEGEAEWEDDEKLDFDINNHYKDEEQGVYQKDQTEEIAVSPVLATSKARRHGVISKPHKKKVSFPHEDEERKKADECVGDASRHPVLNEKQLGLNPNESDKTQTTISLERSQDNLETHGADNKGFEPCKEVEEVENDGTRDLPVPCKTPNERKRPKTLQDWLKDPKLYKVRLKYFCLIINARYIENKVCLISNTSSVISEWSA